MNCEPLNGLIIVLRAGKGRPMFPALDRPIDLRLLEARTFPLGVTYLRYAVD